METIQNMSIVVDRDRDTVTKSHETTAGRREPAFRQVQLAAELKVIAVDDAAQTFTVVMLLHTMYRDDDYLQKLWNNKPSRRKSKGFIKVEDYEGFLPDVTVVNCVDLQFNEHCRETRVDYSSGQIWTSFYNSCTIKDTFLLATFPFDRQLFDAKLKSSNAILRPWKERMDILSFPTAFGTFVVSAYLEEWELEQFKVSYSPSKRDVVSIEDGSVVFTFYMQRRPAYFYRNYMIVVYFIVQSGFAVIGIDPDDVADRQTISMTLLLALVAFRFAMMHGVMKMGSSTYLSTYVELGFLVMVLFVFENLLVSSRTRCVLSNGLSCAGKDIEGTVDGEVFDIIFHLAFALLWFLLHLLCGVCTLFPSLIRRGWSKLAKEKERVRLGCSIATRAVLNSDSNQLEKCGRD